MTAHHTRKEHGMGEETLDLSPHFCFVMDTSSHGSQHELYSSITAVILYC